ncbi:lysophospholipid acyltransferase family protein [Oharaeibacter diazotrophicus]|uniref:1-acyl-sn-glycerol-3-phosphate acyltransferase n=1 Tax=Oharaeibacter diazotrophicus TaxID=1920512 RepID=A0A4R6RCY4_9HYPH|nr:lysophospholipid acyltransferase family protein [Oharaeibacter diazotrophicus]TDP84091.1 1-acyl-sn-glycerol-3-phosphate acyltransferase [Oharaeibacter diazotrophicus]BBE73130.1 1-acyl-sn-glycerol-3-phosphate acyltransferase [Pleomorphomonas sp. SM30]GLS74919.1 1-acyl-sn-glycerol-3-phosphate acyltransferase [Oharaeibacter diazotrophicus]
MVFRTLVYNVVFYVSTLVMMIVGAPTMIPGRRTEMAFVRLWSRIQMALHRAIVGARHEIRGLERMPKTGCIVAMKHQSTWETIAMIPLLEDPAFILKRELMWIPFFGWWAARAKMIPVDRGRGRDALRAMTERAKKAVDEGRQIAIFPEGTRREAGAEPAYKFGVAVLYRDLDVPIVPVALNAGLVWPRRGVHRRGTIVAEVLEPIPAGLDPKTAFLRLQLSIEEACDQLLLEAADRGDELSPTAARRVAELRAGAGTRITEGRVA